MNQLKEANPAHITDVQERRLADWEKLDQEANILKKLRHKNVVKFLEYLETPNGKYKLYIMELCQGGDLL